MTSVMRFAVLMIAAVTLTGCASRPMNQLASMQPSGAAFDNALAQDYAALSKAEKFQGDHRDADTYAQRATAAAGGQSPGPDQVELRQPFLKGKYVSELSDARQRLVSALDKTGRTKAPEDAARAQTSYDCWVEQASEDLQPADVNACKQAFMDAIAKVEAALAAEEPAPVPEAAVPPESYLVFFDLDKADVTPEGMSIVESAAADASAKPFNRIIALGHADTSGSDSYNRDLSQRRADAVKSALTEFGVQADAIETEALGETQPLVPTDDGVREPQNRRVEIVIEH
ncbi:MAG: OmpA family protein [Pseudomonadota bacterium]|nr:OmpA family protein [Pseudomonadota bacterium]